MLPVHLVALLICDYDKRSLSDVACWRDSWKVNRTWQGKARHPGLVKLTTQITALVMLTSLQHFIRQKSKLHQ